MIKFNDFKDTLVVSGFPDNWDSWISELESQDGCKHIRLKSGEYLSDVVKIF